MSAFPSFTNVPPHVVSRISERKGSPYNVSKLNSWVRVSSGVGSGLMLYSNPNFATFKSAGDNNVATIYGNNSTSGVIGVTWGGGAVYAPSGQGFKPSPVISSIEIDEGAGDLSRKASFSITAFTKEQMEELCKYFLEPGYSVFLEWGWNTPNSVNGFQSTLSPSYVAKFQSFSETNAKRIASGGEYDNYLGFITSGQLSLNGDKWTISVGLTGFTELPGYMSSTDTVEDSVTKTGVSNPTIKPAEPFGANFIQQAADSGEIGKERFMKMFNDLPDSRKTIRVQNLINSLSDVGNFINWDEDVAEQINGDTDGSWFGLKESKVKIGDTEVALPTGTQLISNNRFIKFGALMDIMFALGANGYQLSNGKTINFRINTSKTYCLAFKHIFSIDPTKLFIPNPNTPKFKIGESNGLDENDVQDNSIGLGVQFPSQSPLSEVGKLGERISQAANFWGKLDDLYVNFDFAKSVLETKNFVVKDALYQLLNGMSDAVNGLWDFQIVEREIEDGVTELGVIDLSFISATPGSVSLNLNILGEQSVLIDSSLDLNINGAKMDQIIGQRLERSINANGKALPATLFGGQQDKVLNIIDDAGEVTQQETLTAEDKDSKKEEALNVALGKLFLYPFVDKKTAEDVAQQPLYDICYVGAFKDVETFSKLKKKELSGISGGSALMPINFTFKIHGISGIKRGDMFTVSGLPSMYSRQGAFFQVLGVKHIVENMTWTTEVTGGWRG